MIVPLARINNGPKIHAVSQTGRTVCGQPLDLTPDSCGLSMHVTCIGCMKRLVNLGLLDQKMYLFRRRIA